MQLMEKHGIDRVYNADQTAVFFEYLPKQTISGRGAQTVRVPCAGKEKERVTVMLLGDSYGNRYTPFVIAKAEPSGKEDVTAENKALRHGFGTGVWKEVSALQSRLDVVMYGNTKGWWSGELSLTFLRHHFANRPDKDKPLLLLWDDLSAHWTAEVKACADEQKLCWYPCTSVCQPADISWNMPLKARLRALWLENLQYQLTQPRAAGVKFKLLTPKRKCVTEWVVVAWEGLSREVIQSAFSFIVKPAHPNNAPAATATLLANLQSRQPWQTSYWRLDSWIACSERCKRAAMLSRMPWSESSRF
ncbi:hypothetical protein PC129_g14988 [Phytophthora cactorum]|uniref:DDE-1 domain-containing protein n=1 Tax=Phytophthora cactorum TaxID=29920 RepID=A0A329RYZ9_9STRA|nr:hypothetical protein Pcac1_g6757 [Phytophthora cactorum]KAG2804353.1 hypothetical protein PC111_g18292 [Phytophthora cactorum]KAG2809382.1 hypothetical protein PC112_g16530 [Phytophthora cactorum]KAG2893074.1 hypothetical protein PC115_g18591 [Phytophthora cactorum]KAG2917445.1 hypothetical protein PC117_g17426 [Phytophthora cactorum]